jgi:hypothetical protein
MAFPRVFDAHKLIVGLVYPCGLCGARLDQLHRALLRNSGSRPWNPGTGLSFVLLLLFGLRMDSIFARQPVAR